MVVKSWSDGEEILSGITSAVLFNLFPYVTMYTALIA